MAPSQRSRRMRIGSSKAESNCSMDILRCFQLLIERQRCLSAASRRGRIVATAGMSMIPRGRGLDRWGGGIARIFGTRLREDTAKVVGLFAQRIIGAKFSSIFGGT